MAEPRDFPAALDARGPLIIPGLQTRGSGTIIQQHTDSPYSRLPETTITVHREGWVTFTHDPVKLADAYRAAKKFAEWAEERIIKNLKRGEI